jgi:hypothetical protein
MNIYNSSITIPIKFDSYALSLNQIYFGSVNFNIRPYGHSRGFSQNLRQSTRHWSDQGQARIFFSIRCGLF